MNPAQCEMATVATIPFAVTGMAGVTQADEDDAEWMEFLALSWPSKPSDFGTEATWKHAPQSLLY